MFNSTRFQIHTTFQIPDSRFQIPDSRFQIPVSRFQILDSIPDHWWDVWDPAKNESYHNGGMGLHLKNLSASQRESTADFRWKTDFRFWKADFRFRIKQILLWVRFQISEKSATDFRFGKWLLLLLGRFQIPTMLESRFQKKLTPPKSACRFQIPDFRHQILIP